MATIRSVHKKPVVKVRDVDPTENTPLLTDELDGNNGALYPTYEENTSSSCSSSSSISSDHESQLPAAVADDETAGVGVWASLSVLLVGVFMSQADATLVLAIYGKVSSEFNDLESGSWLMSAYILSQACAQPLYGKLSDIFGRKACLQASYTLFLLGTIAAALGQSMAQIIGARVLQGAGGAGMVCMVSIIITDLVPVHEVAALRSYVNVVQTVGRSSGGALGGWLAQVVGWRWAFLGQAPFLLLAIILVQWRLHIQPKSHHQHQHHHHHTVWQKLKRIDFAGALFLSITILAFCLTLDIGGQKVPWNSPTIYAIAGAGVVSATLFVLSSKYWAAEPIFPLRLLTHRDAVSSYSILTLQNLMQFSLMMAIPMYFQVVEGASTAAAGAYMVPSIVGNTTGALLAGQWMRRAGRVKAATVLAPLSSMLMFALCTLAWRGEGTSVAASFVSFPGGFATGVSHSSLFVGLAAAMAPEDIAMASAGLYLSGNIGGLMGLSGSSAVYQLVLRSGLRDALAGRADRDKIIEKALSNLEYIRHVGKELRRLMIPAYVHSFHTVFIIGMGFAGLSLIIACFSREQRLKGR